MPFIIHWEYTVKEEFLNDFTEFYGNNGSWVQLFRQSEGYLKTELFQQQKNSFTFETKDYWESEAAYRSFLETYSEDYQKMDIACEKYTLDERKIGESYVP